MARSALARASAGLALAATAAAQASQMATCDTAPMLRDITAVQTACCADMLASDCATGLPDTCSAACRPVFLNFLATYRDPALGCAYTLEIFGEHLNLHPLEVSCNGGVDPTAGHAQLGVCDMKTAMSTCQASGVPSGATSIAAMCVDPCLVRLIPCAHDPTLLAAMGAGEAATLAQLQTACGAQDTVGGNTPGDGRCSVADLQSFCSAHPSSGIAADECASTCTLEMLDCASDPAAAAYLDPARVQELQHVCHSSTGDTGPGDGTCNLVAAGNLCGPNDMETSDPATFCQHACVREMIDCIDDPSLQSQRATIANMQSLCVGGSAGCVAEVTGLDAAMQAPCCSGTPCLDGPPPQCSVTCAQMFLPFYDRCGMTFAQMAVDQPKGSSGEMDVVAAELATFHTQCLSAAGGGGH